MRLDAGEVINGKNYVYLQVNSQAKSDGLKKWLSKNGSDTNLAVGCIDVNTAPEDQKQAARSMEIFETIPVD